jgi:hypothetical protein
MSLSSVVMTRARDRFETCGRSQLQAVRSATTVGFAAPIGCGTIKESRYMSTTEPRQAPAHFHERHADVNRDIVTLRDDELDAVTGGSFDIGNIYGSIAKPLAH